MLKKHLAKAHCSVSELYLTDLCYEDDAETKCEEAINRAIAADAETLDGQQGKIRKMHVNTLAIFPLRSSTIMMALIQS